MRYFNTSGPCVPGLHYMLPPEPRLPDARELIEQSRYFIVHAPRQTGKTTTMAALARDLNAAGRHVALVFSCEQARWTGDDIGAAEDLILGEIAAEASAQDLGPELLPPSPWPDAAMGGKLRAGLTAWARACPLPLALFFDEIDALRGNSLISVLSQLRAGHNARPSPFPASVVLCGLRDIRDYRAAAGGHPDRLGTSSPFNVAVESMRISNFTEDQVAELYAQHTADTGQEFQPDAVDRAFEYSQGQPWLVNAIAYEIVSGMRIEPSEPVTAAHVDQAKERLILARATHLDYLTTRLAEPRVQRVLEPLLAGDVLQSRDPVYDDDVSYVRDLGLIAERPPIRVANPIYKEVIVRVLTAGIQESITARPNDFLLPDGQIDFEKVLVGFAEFWHSFGEVLLLGGGYNEFAAQLVFMAYLQRVVNGGGFVDREYGIGMDRVDLLARKPYTGTDGKSAVQREAIELKVRRQGRGNPLKVGLAQIDGYLDRLGLDTGTLVIFDRRPSTVRDHPYPQFSRASTPSGREITLLTA
ncbi:MAG: ATP-binding protein [Trebonia sp.]